MIFPLEHENLGYFPHVVWRSVSEDKKHVVIPLSQGKFEVHKIIAWDEAKNAV